MTPAIRISEIAERIAALFADCPTGIVSMPELAEAISKHEGGTIDTNRGRIRRAVEQCDSLEMVELTTRRGDWDVMLPDGQAFMPAWIASGYDADTRRTVWRFVPSRDRVSSGYGSGRTTWIATRAAMAGYVAARQKTACDERAAYMKKLAAETTARWAEARQRDPEYVRLLQLLTHDVPGVEVRVMPMSRRSGVFAGIEVPSGSAEAFKALLCRAFPDAAADDSEHDSGRDTENAR